MLCDFGEVVLSVDTTNRIQFVDAEEFFAVYVKLITINRKRDFVFAAASDLGKEVKELTYDANEITSEAFIAAEARKFRLHPTGADAPSPDMLFWT